MQNPESVQENEMHPVLWNFEIKTDHIILARRLDLELVNKKQRTCRIVDFGVPTE